MTKKDLIDQLEEVDDNAEVKVAYEGSIEEYPIVNVTVESGEAVIEFRNEE